MLVLSRKADETIVLPELGISIEVLRIKGNVVRLGIKAPDSVHILRGELEAVVNEFQDDCSFPMQPSTPLGTCAAANVAAMT
jgi:carbon storage regulator